MDERKFQALQDYCTRNVPRPPYAQKTKFGTYLPTPLVRARTAFEYLLREGIIREGENFLDAGSGDGRIVALACLFGLNGVGVECNPHLVETSETLLSGLNTRGILNRTPRIAYGDFLQDNTYQSLSLPFEEANVVFNYFNNHLDLARKVARQSRAGTRFLLYDWEKEACVFNGLEHIADITLDESCEERYRDDYLHVYIK